MTSKTSPTVVSAESNESSFNFPSIDADGPISITDDTGLESYPGSGTIGDPYRIENLDIVTGIGSGIYIWGTTHYFQIINCSVISALVGININLVADGTVKILNCTVDSGDSGIYVYDVNYAEVINNTIINTNVGISYDLCDYSYIHNNTVSSGYRGIFIEDSYQASVKYNYIYNCTEEGILAQNCDEITIQNNTCNDNREGIHVYSCYNPYVEYNYCSDNERRGIYVRYSDYAIIGGNNFHACGLGVYDSVLDDLLTVEVNPNYIDGIPICYLENMTSGMIVTTYSQIILVNCSNIQVSNQPLSESLYIAVYLIFCDGISIYNNLFKNCYYGLTLLNSDNTNIQNNFFYDCTSGIGADTSFKGLITINDFYNNTLGIHFLNHVDNFTIILNHFEIHSSYAIALEVSDYNTIYHNNFLYSGALSYGYDSGQFNIWYNATLFEGNYWSNYVGPGIYDIDGPANSDDLYPLNAPLDIPFVSEFAVSSWFVLIFLLLIPASVVFVLNKKR